MIIRQISVFVENRPGTLVEVLDVLKDHEINLRALSVADTADFGILRLIVNDPEKVERIFARGRLCRKIDSGIDPDRCRHSRRLAGEVVENEFRRHQRRICLCLCRHLGQ